MNVNEFLGFYFPHVNDPASREVVAIGGDRKDNTSWTARPWKPDKMVEPPGRLYFCISTVNAPASPRANKVTKGALDLVRTYVIGLDDIRGGRYVKVDKAGVHQPGQAVPVQPTTRLESSAGNEQWFYRLSYPADPQRAAALIDAIADAGMSDSGAKRGDRYMRVPGSLNTKHSPPFACRVIEHHPERSWTLSELEVAFGVTPDEPRALPDEVAPLGPGEVDPVWEAIQERPGLVRGPAGPRGWVPIACFNAASHTPGKGHDDGTHYKPSSGGGVFKCLHGHCAGLDTDDFREWLFGDSVPDLTAFGALLDRAIGEALAAGPAPEGRQGEGVRFDKVVDGRAQDDHDEAMRRTMVESYIHVEAQNKYWSVRSESLVERAAVDDSSTAGMRRTSLLHVYSEASGKRLKDMAVSTWLRQQRDLRRVANLTHRLGQPLIVDNMLNIAPPIPARPVADGEPEPWLDLVDYICGNDDEADQVLDWMALVVTAWDEKPGWHLLVKGPPGAGKDLMLSPMVRYLAPKHWYGLTVKDIESGFTPFLARRLVMIDELKMTTRGTINTHDIYNVIKAWTARGTQWVMINEKNVKPYEALDLSCWAPTSNAEVPLPLEDGDRRWYVVEAPRRVRPKGYYMATVKWLEEGGWKMAIGWLQRRWDAMSEPRREAVRGVAPMTKAKLELIVNSAEGIDGAVRLAIDGRHGETWPDLVTVGDVLDRLRSSDLMSDLARRNLTSKRVAMALKGAGAIQLFDGAQIEDKAIRRRVRLWCTRLERVSGYEKLGQGKEMIDEYDRQKGGSEAFLASKTPHLRVVPSDT